MSMQKINLRVWLKIPDAEAATVKNTLVRRMGFGECPGDVKKERLFTIEVDSGDPRSWPGALSGSWSTRTRRATRSLIDELKFEEGYVPVKVALHIEDGEAISIRDRLRNRLGIQECGGCEEGHCLEAVPSGRATGNAWPGRLRKGCSSIRIRTATRYWAEVLAGHRIRQVWPGRRAAWGNGGPNDQKEVSDRKA